MDKKLIKRFFMNKTNPEETEKVLAWFDKEEGEQYLHEKMDIDYDLMDSQDLREMVPELDSNTLYQSINTQVSNEDSKFLKSKPDWVATVIKSAATILVLILVSIFYNVNYMEPIELDVESKPIHFKAYEKENREITLSDGSLVRLNSNSEVIILKDFLEGTREVRLFGEAYFDVKPNPDRPFIIHVNQSTIRVLGTSFNVHSFPLQNNVQVAVIDGRVSFTNKNSGDNGAEHENRIILTKGQYAYLDIEKSTFQVDSIAIENYLAWKSGEFVFKGLPLQKVCLQLNRIYESRCDFEDPKISKLTLTAKFSKDSLEKTLSVIALTLNIEFKNDDGFITWYKES